MARWCPSNVDHGNLPNRIIALTSITLAVAMECAQPSPALASDVAKRPNIVLILADDKDCLTGDLVEKCVKLLRISSVSGSFEVPQTSVN